MYQNKINSGIGQGVRGMGQRARRIFVKRVISHPKPDLLPSLDISTSRTRLTIWLLTGKYENINEFSVINVIRLLGILLYRMRYHYYKLRCVFWIWNYFVLYIFFWNPKPVWNDSSNKTGNLLLTLLIGHILDVLISS